MNKDKKDNINLNVLVPMILEFTVVQALPRLLYSAACASYISRQYFLYIDTDSPIQAFQTVTDSSPLVLYCRLETWETYME